MNRLLKRNLTQLAIFATLVISCFVWPAGSVGTIPAYLLAGIGVSRLAEMIVP